MSLKDLDLISCECASYLCNVSPICQHYTNSFQLIASNEAQNLCQLHRMSIYTKLSRLLMLIYAFCIWIRRALDNFLLPLSGWEGRDDVADADAIDMSPAFVALDDLLVAFSSHRRTAKLECKLCSLLTWKCVVRIFLSNCKSRTFQPQLGIFFCGHPNMASGIFALKL